MIDGAKKTPKTSDDFNRRGQMIQIVDENSDVCAGPQDRSKLSFFYGLLAGMAISFVAYLAILFLLLR